MRRGSIATLLLYIIIITFLILLIPKLAADRVDNNGFRIYYADGIPVAIGQVYYFTFLGLLLAFSVAFRKRISLPGSLLLALSGLFFYEFFYALTYAVYARSPYLLLPKLSFPASGWNGYGTWFLLSALLLLLSFPYWKFLSLTWQSVLCISVFIAGIIVWAVFLKMDYPPFFDSPEVYAVNTITEVAGCIVLPASVRNRAKVEGGLLFRKREDSSIT